MPKTFSFGIFFLLFAVTVNAQKDTRVVHEQCGTMEHLELKFENDPTLKAKFEQSREAFNTLLRQVANRTTTSSLDGTRETRSPYLIPVVFHIVLTNPNLVTDAQIQKQLDTLNIDFFGTNADSVKIPSYFKPFFGKSNIQFCLAQRTPDGETTTGIERIVTNQTSFSTNDAVKHITSSGANVWNSSKYFNVWVCQLSGGILGYSTFPDDGLASEQGVVMDYRSLPGGSSTNYNSGKTLTHETGHYFNLYHIWGDDNGACTGTDFIDDTPNQGGSTSGCYSGVKTDNCTTAGNGIMYQNYMDYTYDNCMVMFTTQQVTRMETALLTYRASLLTSDGCLAPIQRNYDVQLRSINQPAQRICTNTFSPVVTIRNRGIQTLTSATITTKIDNGSTVSYNWTGALPRYSAADVTLNTSTVSAGNHILTIYVSNPNNNKDEDPTNDTLSIAFQYYPPVTSVSESFEGATFPPPGWDVVNPDNSITWKRVTGIAKTGIASATIDNFNYSVIGEKDDLRLPNVTLQGVDSAFLSFQLAAATYTDLNTSNNSWDTLEVLISTDCGQTYTSLYKKYGSSLVTKSSYTSPYVPASNEWRKDSLNLADYINRGNVLIAFRNTTGNENSIYLDDINVRTVIINPNLKRQGILITPNPTTGMMAVQFYPQPTNLRGIQVYNLTGQKINEVPINSGANNYYSININNQPSGEYIVRVIFSDRVVTRKIIKL